MTPSVAPGLALRSLINFKRSCFATNRDILLVEATCSPHTTRAPKLGATVPRLCQPILDVGLVYIVIGTMEKEAIEKEETITARYRDSDHKK